MRTPEDKDVTTLVIARTLAIFVVVLGGLHIKPACEDPEAVTRWAPDGPT